MSYRARTITTCEGKFLNVEDMRNLLRDDKFVDEHLVPALVVGRDKGDSVTQIVRIMTGTLLCAAAGEGPYK